MNLCPLGAAVFTSDTTIGIDDTEFDGTDMVITNCTVTVDGPHTFNTLQVRKGGTLTHTQEGTNGFFVISGAVAGEVHVLGTNAPTATLNDSNAVITSVVIRDQTGTITYTNEVDYTLSQPSAFVAIDLLPGSAIPDGSIVLVNYDTLRTIPSGLNLTVTGNAFIELGGSINASARGYNGGVGVGHGNPQGNPASGGGGGYGGYGGRGSSNDFGGNSFGSILQPIDKGSGGGSGLGGSGCSGGGAVSLAVGGTLQIDGSILVNAANATNSRSGGGSGGSIWLQAQTVAGAGSLLAEGGAGEPVHGGGGGGGRIAVYCGTNLFSGNMLARGGLGFVIGGAGTIYTRNTNDTVGQVLVDNGGRAGTNSLLNVPEPVALTVRGGANVSPASSAGSGIQLLSSLSIESNSWMSSLPSPFIFNVSVLGSATISAGGGILADGRGFPGGQGTGFGLISNVPGIGPVGSGGGYGGMGGPLGGNSYGSLLNPVDRGSGGGSGAGVNPANLGGSGGGLIQLLVTGTLALDGRISANGNSGGGVNSGGGSGGSVQLTVNSLLTGTGSISASGGPGNGLGGGGGGGRILVSYISNQFSGPISAYGGVGGSTGGAGTIAKRRSGITEAVIIDNGGKAGAFTGLGNVPAPLGDFSIIGRAAVAWPSFGSFTAVNFLVGSNSLVVVTNSTAAAALITVTSNAIVEAGGWIKGDGDKGPSTGLGNGSTFSSAQYGLTGGGGAHGGYGGASLGGAAGGIPFDSFAQPSNKGGNGAPIDISGAQGGAGGYAIRLTINGTLQLNGKLSADGRDGASLHSGGGAGGGIWLTLGSFSGTGVLSANGGRGNGVGGSGSGGRIALYFATNSFLGTVSARGGSNANVGAAGTIYTKANSQSIAVITADNGGATGAVTPISPVGSDIILSGGAMMTSDDSAPAMRNLLINSNAWLVISNRNSSITVTLDAVIQNGGGIIADGGGFGSANGPGAGKSASGQIGAAGSGASHGGIGGSSTNGLTGGNVYDLIQDAAIAGSGGGNGGGTTGQAPGGSGGGLIRLTVSRNLQVDGVISANGTSGLGLGAGGGSGGSVRLSALSLFGLGRISVNGGAGSDPGSGGGGGGRITIVVFSNIFSGAITAFGGTGYNRGGAGTIFIQSSPQQISTSVIVDNGGAIGALTPITSMPSGGDLTVRNGGVSSLSGQFSNLRSILINSNSFLFVTNLSAQTISSNVTIAAGGVMSTDGTVSGQGPGTGRTSLAGGSGGGHGGMGGSSAGIAGGSAYDTVQPTQAGSSGAGPNVGTGFGGGSGGGLIVMTITGTLNVDGLLTANGLPGTNANSGGGSGGGLSFNVTRFSGSGRIQANGGAGTGNGGGGGGGRISVLYVTNTYTGAISAFGGSGFGNGGAGTILLRQQNQTVGQLTLDNGGPVGAPSSVASTSPAFTDVTLKRGAVLSLSAIDTPFPIQVVIRNLLITSNSWVVLTNVATLSVSNATVEAGGGIIGDGNGSSPGGGQGFGRTTSLSTGGSGGGAGHGGVGANSFGGALGGISYGAITGPTLAGSGGGAGAGTGTNALGGAGGAALRINATANLQVDGIVSMNGNPGFGINSGGGSGGSVWLTVGGTLSGAGRISANGGPGNASGGGGGGGRIAISFGTNAFTGILSAFGAGGNGWGGAGTIYLSPTKGGNRTPQLIVDNGGPAGMTTPVSGISGDLLVRRGGVAVPANGSSIQNLVVSSNSWLMVSNLTPLVSLTVFGNATVEAGGVITGDGASGSTTGAGGTLSGTGGGGGHAGFGAMSAWGAFGGTTYGSTTVPFTAGSRGGNGINQGFGGSGGGALRLTVSGSLFVNGRISMDGISSPNPNSGGGSGGSFALTTGGLFGTGTISASGGDGNGLGGGGAGGRIAISYASNNFAGVVIARGANGGFGAGGAGTIYTRAGLQAVGQLLLDNGGLSGGDTPLTDIGLFDLTVANGAVTYPAASLLSISNLFVNAGGLVTIDPSRTNLELYTLNDLVIREGGAISVDGQGFAQATGPGAGQASGGYGSGGGYGGMGGASWTTFGGFPYGSVTEPVERGSGGGFGSGPAYAGGSQGGGAIRLNVGGVMTIDGSLSANGSAALQDGSGGGSGGSIWAAARTVRGGGFITADGGAGELFGGGGGGGGRIAVYYLTNPGHTNNFTGLMTAYGGEGEYWGDDGSVFFSAGLPALRVISQTPVGIVSNAVSSVDVTFNSVFNLYSASSSDATVMTPNGPLPPNVSPLSPYTLRVLFPLQTAVGNYAFNVGPLINDLYGRPMSQVYTGAFTISLPVIQGTVTGKDGQPVPGVLIQPSDATSPVTTDANGNYALGFVPGSSFTLTPVFNGYLFAPASRSYSSIAASVAGEDYIMATTIAADIASTLEETNVIASWLGLAGVTYQAYTSTNLFNWEPYGPPIMGSNAPVRIPLPITDDIPEKYLRVDATSN